MFTIGEFSRMTGLSVKTLRFYHEEGLLIPRYVDSGSGYRHYSEEQIETARAIAYLRGLDFSLNDIREILQSQQAGEPVVESLERHKTDLEQKMKQMRAIVRTLEKFIADERQALTRAESEYQIQNKTLDSVIVAGIRMSGPYSDCGRAFGKMGRVLGRWICGPPFLLHYVQEYKETDADYEACFPIRTHKTIDGIHVRELPGGTAMTLVHRGPYGELGRSYGRILREIRKQRTEIVMPTREVYLKGPGIIFRGNPQSYLTEIQILLGEGRETDSGTDT